jgi:hypothetical protein
MLDILSDERRQAVQRCLDVDVFPSAGEIGFYNCKVFVIDPDADRQFPPYVLPNVSLEDLGARLNEWSTLHRDGQQRPLPVYFRNVAGPLLARFTARF